MTGTEAKIKNDTIQNKGNKLFKEESQCTDHDLKKNILKRTVLAKYLGRHAGEGNVDRKTNKGLNANNVAAATTAPQASQITA